LAVMLLSCSGGEGDGVRWLAARDRLVREDREGGVGAVTLMGGPKMERSVDAVHCSDVKGDVVSIALSAAAAGGGGLVTPALATDPPAEQTEIEPEVCLASREDGRYAPTPMTVEPGTAVRCAAGVAEGLPNESADGEERASTAARAAPVTGVVPAPTSGSIGCVGSVVAAGVDGMLPAPSAEAAAMLACSNLCAEYCDQDDSPAL